MNQIQSIIKRLKRGWMTPAQAFHECGSMKLASRVSELRANGVNIVDKWCESGGKKFKAYRIAR
jgi:hypothetical protein